MECHVVADEDAVSDREGKPAWTCRSRPRRGSSERYQRRGPAQEASSGQTLDNNGVISCNSCSWCTRRISNLQILEWPGHSDPDQVHQ